ncbi:MAG: serine hydrolase domain-containing protein [Promethearchaeota archaeon]|jgi:CubicO group peptidase (beta-lactamase class C family)
MKKKFWPSNSSEWTEIAPEEQGLDSDKIADMFEFIEKNSYDIHSVIIVRNGYLLTEKYLYKSQVIENKSYPGREKTHDQASMTKSLMSIAIGIALQEGFLNNLNQTLYEFFADIWDPSFVDSEPKKNITIEQLLTMNSGLVNDWNPRYPPDAKTRGGIDILKWALEEVPLGFTPGEPGKFEYSNDGPNLLSAIITNVSGKSTVEFAKEYLFTPLEISEDEYYWWHDEKCICSGGFGFACSPKVQAKLGMLCLNNGSWNEKQIVDSNFMKNAITTQISWGKPGDLKKFKKKWLEYGYLFYTNGPFGGYYMSGAGGQSIYVIPKYDIIVGFTGAKKEEKDYNNLIENYILQFAEKD